MPALTKSVYDSPSGKDGARVLVTRYWPRGVPRSAADAYVSAVAPSRELLRAYKDGDVDWTGFRARYLDEMKGDAQRDAVTGLAERSRTGTVTLMCTCREPKRCHTSLLRILVNRRSRTAAR